MRPTSSCKYGLKDFQNLHAIVIRGPELAAVAPIRGPPTRQNTRRLIHSIPAVDKENGGRDVAHFREILMKILPLLGGRPPQVSPLGCGEPADFAFR